MYITELDSFCHAYVWWESHLCLVKNITNAISVKPTLV